MKAIQKFIWDLIIFILIFTFLTALGMTISKEAKAETSDEYCMAQIIHHEARGEPYSGKLAVGHVVMNRVKSKRYPNTVCGVITTGEFQNFKLGRNKPSPESIKAAKNIKNTPDPTNGALFFRVYRGQRGIKIGNHIFRRVY